MIHAFAILAFAAGGICGLIFFLFLFAGDSESLAMLSLTFVSLLSGAILWGFAEIKDDVRQLRLALAPSTLDKMRSAKNEIECQRCHMNNPKGSTHCIRCERPI